LLGSLEELAETETPSAALQRQRFGSPFAAEHHVARRYTAALLIVAAVMGARARIWPALRAAPREAVLTKPKPQKKSKPRANALTDETRRAFIRRAQIWMPTDIPAMDLRAGPQGPGALPPNALVTCDYVEKEKLPGTSRKFDCAVGPEDVVKVRY